MPRDSQIHHQETANSLEDDVFHMHRWLAHVMYFSGRR